MMFNPTITPRQMQEIERVKNDPLYFYNKYLKEPSIENVTIEAFNTTCNIYMINTINSKITEIVNLPKLNSNL